MAVRGRKNEYYEEKWWDEECHSKEVALNTALKELRRGEISEEEWRKQRREYKNFLENKKWNKGKEWLLEMEKDKGMKLFWGAVRSNKRYGAQVDSSTAERWKDHFREQHILEQTTEESLEGREIAVEEEGKGYRTYRLRR